ncbi:MAG TPA: DUF6036 family nucleotidyltransferase [Baekduia sp.]|uniref:DUF6036 family nucleotidyltransferase n=1 Tax=Baekduia sp. TaxID=2600305 RepID=UPI002D788AC7|nr:DUF6036 family nucleotidyltransferase [Baekduia sp.]HET6506934.1 DUF6036 family nucleotidyltransferase [Baekduia sp.]
MQDIDTYRLDAALSALGEQLALAGNSAHLVVIGGSGLLAIDAISRSTQDVDVVALERHGKLVSPQPLPAPIADAAALVARDLGLEPNWLNPGPTSLLDLGLPDGFADRLSSRDYGSALRVSFASRIDQIYLKLYAAADRREPRDFADLRRLAPTDQELRAGARWARTHRRPGPFDDAVARALADLGVQDDGRDA